MNILKLIGRTNLHVPKNIPPQERYVKFCQRFDGILFQAKDQAAECIQRGGMINDRCYVLPPTTAENEVLSSKQRKSPFTKNRKHIVYVGSVQPRKAQDIAIKSFSILAKQNDFVDLHLVGGGLETNYGKQLRTLSSNLNLNNRIYFHGHRKDYLRYMAHSDIILQSSKAEGVSRVLREAMLFKVPIVATSISGTRSILEAEQDALLVESGNKKAIAQSLQKIISDNVLSQKLTSNAFKKYLLNHSSSAYKNNIISILKTISQN